MSAQVQLCSCLDVPERALYGSVLLLAVVPIMVGSQLASPAVGYVKAMDVWVVAHFFFLAVAVLEVLLIHLVFGKSLRAARKPQTDQIELTVSHTNTTFKKSH